MADGYYRLTYRDIAERLGISPDAARMKANRKAKAGLWRLLPDETAGQERLVEIPSADLDGIAPKAAPAERSAHVEKAERPAQATPAAPTEMAERPVALDTAERFLPAETPDPAERPAPSEPYVVPKVSISFEPQHPHLPPVAAEQARSGEPIATPERPASEAVERSATTTPNETGERSHSAEQGEQPVPAAMATAGQAVAGEQAEQPAPAERAAMAEPVEVQPDARSGDEDLDESAAPDPADTLFSTLTARVATLTNRLLEETNARAKEREELDASAVRERELKVEIERLCTRVSELTAELEQARRPWWRSFIQGGSGSN